MKQMVCEMCGGTDLVKQDGVFVCQSCGCKYSVEEAKKMMIEGNVDVSGSTVKVDSSEKLKNLYQLARRAKDDNNSENAQKYYEQIAVEDPNSWEASFYGVYYTAMNCKIGQIGNAAYSVKNSIGSTFELIKNYVDKDAQSDAYEEVSMRVESIGAMLLNGAMSHYADNATASGIRSEVSVWNSSILSMVETLGDRLDSDFGDKDAAINAYKVSLKLYSNAGSVSGVYSSWKKSIEDKIIALDASYQNVVNNEKTANEIKSLENQARALRNKKDNSGALIGSGVVCVGCGLFICMLASTLGGGWMLAGIFFAGLGILEFCMVPGKKKEIAEAQKKAAELDVQIEELKKKQV